MTDDARFEAGYWDAASEYRRIAADFTAAFARDALRLAALPERSKLLDIAAGTGAASVAAADAGHEVLAVDFAPAMLAQIDTERRPAIRTQVMDGQALTLPEAAFDAVTSMFGIVLFDDYRAGLSEAARVLKPGGIAVIGTWEHPAGAAANIALAEMTSALFPDHTTEAGFPGLTATRSRAGFTQAMQAAGLTDVAIHAVTHPFDITREMVEDPELLFTFSPVWKALTPNERERVAAEVAGQCENMGGVWAIPSTALIAVATRP